MSALAKLMIANTGASERPCSTNASVASGALISGLWSYVGTSRGDGTSSRTSPGYGCSSPPLKKYVTCGYFSVSATCSWPSPRSASTLASVVAGRCGGENTRGSPPPPQGGVGGERPPPPPPPPALPGKPRAARPP